MVQLCGGFDVGSSTGLQRRRGSFITDTHRLKNTKTRAREDGNRGTHGESSIKAQRDKAQGETQQVMRGEETQQEQSKDKVGRKTEHKAQETRVSCFIVIVTIKQETTNTETVKQTQRHN